MDTRNKSAEDVRSLCYNLIATNIQLLNSKNIKAIKLKELKNPSKEFLKSFEGHQGCINLNPFLGMAKKVLLDLYFSPGKKEKCRLGNKKSSATDIMLGFRIQLLNNGKINF
ncbi:MAG: hypothetical protein PHF86_02490 [Candidatus Nanoarchaeia archaeon]|nr:hypothetical protein [Candidatus Nanoarchaeia archaeon]